jgi:hypothetical protein
VRIVFDRTGPTIALRPSAVFQLLLFGETEQVRDAAAALLEPAVSVPADRMRLLVGDFPALPKSRQIAARLAATAMLRYPSDAVRFLGINPTFANRSPTLRCVFEFETAMYDPSTRRVQGVFETYTWDRGGLELPSTVDQTAVNLRPPMKLKTPLPDCGRSGASWSFTGEVFSVKLLEHGCDFRGTKHWRGVRLYSPEGVLIKEAKAPGGFLSPLGGFEIDHGLLFRLETGALAGHVIDLSFEQPYARPDRSRHCVVSVECGSSLTDPPVAVMLAGNLEPRYPIDAIVGRPTLPMPLLGGETIKDLDTIARRVGVWHGSHLRGSFVHHPLRTAARKEVA